MEESKAKLLKHIDDEKRANIIMSRMKKQMKKQYQKAYISYIRLWDSEFDVIVSKRDKLQDANFNHLKLEVQATYKKDGKLTTNFEPVKIKDDINKAYLDEKLKKKDG